jgi:hypothetical protein
MYITKKNCELFNTTAVPGFNIDKTYSHRCQQIPQLVPIAHHPYYYETKQQKHGFTQSIQNFRIKERGLHGNGYRI